MSPDSQANALRDAVVARIDSVRGQTVDDISVAAEPLLRWIGYLKSSLSNGHSDRLLEAMQASIIEVAAALSLGLVRPAIFSMRVQFELSFAWIYYNDHRIEWEHRERTNSEFVMRAQALKFMRDNDERFDDRLKIMQKKTHGSIADIYGLLSAHVHTTSHYASPSVGPLASVVKTSAQCAECVRLQAEVVEYLAGVFASWHARRWHDFPLEIADWVKAKLSKKDLKEFLD